MSSLPEKPDYGDFVTRANDTRILAYLSQVRNHFRFVSTLGLPETTDRTDFPVERLFVPLRVSWWEPGTDGAVTEHHSNQPEVLVAARQRVVLLGDAGSGKTTFVTWLTHRLADRGRNEVHRRVGELVPLTFVLRDLPITEQTRTWPALLDLLRQQGPWADGLDDVLPTLLAAGQVLVVLDGWDEIADTVLRTALRQALIQAMDAHPRCSFLLTSRPAGYDEVPLESAYVEFGFGDDLDDAFAEAGLGLVRAQVQPFDIGQVRAFALAWYGWRAPEAARERAADLAASIEADPSLTELARVPNLLAMMALVHRRFTRLPGGRAELLGRVVDAFVEGWEAAKGLPRPLTPVAARKRWLQELALVMNRRRVWGASGDDLAALADRSEAAAERVRRLQSGTVIGRAKAEALLVEQADGAQPGTAPDDARAFLDWCLRRSGLLVPRSNDSLAFAHLTLQDWLSAGAMAMRLRSGWLDPELARDAARELGRWAGRAAGGATVLMVLDLLRHEQPEMADQLAVEIFFERAATPAQHRRLLSVAAQADELDKLCPDMDIARDASTTVLLRDASTLEAGLDCQALYIIDSPDLDSLAALADRPPQHPTRRTIYLKHTGVRDIPAALPWRVVDEHGLVYSPEEGLVRPPHRHP